MADTRYAYYNTGDDAQYFVGGVSEKMQSFTSSTTHVVHQIKLYLLQASAGPGFVYVALYAADANHKPTGKMLCNGAVLANNIPATATWITFDLGYGTLLTAGTEYVITTYNQYSGDARARCDESTPAYAGFYGESEDRGATWTTYSSVAMLFEEWGETGSAPWKLYTYYNDLFDDQTGLYAPRIGAMVFTPTTTHYVRAVRLLLVKNGVPTGTLTVSIQALSGGYPTGTALASASINVSTISGAYGWYTFQLSAPVQVTASTSYAIVANYPSGNSTTDYIGWLMISSANPYSGGSYVRWTGSIWETKVYDNVFEEWGTLTESEPVETSSQVNIGDTWKNIDWAGSKLNVGDTWKTIVAVYQNIGDTWRVVYGTLSGGSGEFLTLEDGTSYLLQETGDKIKLESSS